MGSSMRCRTWLPLVLVLSTSGCFAAGHTSSPWEFGLGARVAPAVWQVADGDATAHPMASYTYLDAEAGHQFLWELGGQIRKPISAGSLISRPFWVGAEAALSRLESRIDIGAGYIYHEGTTGYSLTALAGFPVGQSRWGFNFYGGMGLSHYGSTGFNVRAGVDLQPWFVSR
jgi:hypothetical protein